nr:hypothetical protein [Tanacetum cinerariifolium]
MADSWKAMDLNKFVVKDHMIDYVLHKYRSNWQVHDVIADDMLDDLLKRKWEKQKRVKCKYAKRKVTQMKIHDLLAKTIEKAGQHLNKENQIMHINKGKEKMVMKREIVHWYDDLSSDEVRTVYKDRRGSSFRNAAITKPKKPKSRSKHLAPRTPRTGSTCTTVVVQTKRPPPVTNSILGLAAVTTWQQILNKEFGMKISKENVRGSSNVRMKGKRKML